MALARAALKSAWARSLFISVMRFRLPFNDTVWIHVHNLGLLITAAGDGVAAIDVRMPVQQQARLADVHKTTKRLEAGVRQIVAVVDAAWRGVRYQDIQVTAVAQRVRPPH